MDRKIYAIILSGGKGKRMGSSISKQYMMLNDRPILYYSLDSFEKSDVDEVVVVVGKNDKEYVKSEIVDKYNFKKVKIITEGGAERYNSVYNGLMAIDDQMNVNINNTYVLIHDGARPFISVEIINKTIYEVMKDNAVVVGVPVKDTIKIVNNLNDIVDTPDRSMLWQVQTPQAFLLPEIKAAYKKAIESERKDLTDDSMVMETFGGHTVKMIMGDYNNIKITTPEDLIFGSAILNNQ